MSSAQPNATISKLPVFVFKPHPDFESYTREQIRDAVNELDDQMRVAIEAKDEEARVWFLQERRSALAELQRRNGHSATTGQESFWPEPLTYKAFKAQPLNKSGRLWSDGPSYGSTSLLVAPPRVGKTTFALNFGLAVSRGASFLNRETIKSPVFYVSIDNSADEIDEMTEKLGFQDEDQVYIHTGQIPERATEWLVDWIQHFSIKLAIVDTYQRFFHVEEVNSTSQVVAAMEPLDFEAKRLGCHVMYLHHARKNGENFLDAGIGSNSIKGMCPYYFHLARLGDSQQRILSTDFRSGKNFDRVLIKLDTRTGWTYIGGTYEDAIVEDIIPQVIQFLEMEDQATEPVIRKNIPARGIFVSKAIRELYKRGTVERHGKGKKGDPFHYYLAAGLSSISGGIIKGGGNLGLESQKQRQELVVQGENLVPKLRDSNATSTDKDLNREKRGINPDLKSEALRIFPGARVTES